MFLCNISLSIHYSLDKLLFKLCIINTTLPLSILQIDFKKKNFESCSAVFMETLYGDQQTGIKVKNWQPVKTTLLQGTCE